MTVFLSHVHASGAASALQQRTTTATDVSSAANPDIINAITDCYVMPYG